MSGEIHEECGVFAIADHPEASKYAYLGLHALQHRGQESAGICTSDGEQLHIHRQMGLVSDIFTSDVIEKLPGRSAIGHVRYSTAGTSHLQNAQPFSIGYWGGQLAVAHNGNLVNAKRLRAELEADGSIFRTTSDTEVILHLIARSKHELAQDRIAEALLQVEGAYSLVFIKEDKIIAARDRFGFRPLILGKLNGSWVVASETTALGLIEGQYVREVHPGEMIVIKGKSMCSRKLQESPRQANCIFEHVYFARPDSYLFGSNVYESRKRMGRTLAREAGVEADLVVPVPDSGVAAAIGYAEESGIPFEMGLIRSHYVGRTFIEPSSNIRHFGVKLKLGPVESLIRGKRVVVIDDSIVRGTTSEKLVQLFWAAGAREVHVRISAPPTKSPCYYGIDTPSEEELLAANNNIEGICRTIGASSLAYLSIEGMIASTGQDPKRFCHACFSGEYPVKVADSERRHRKKNE